MHGVQTLISVALMKSSNSLSVDLATNAKPATKPIDTVCCEEMKPRVAFNTDGPHT